MRFYNREKELQQLADIIVESRDEAQMTVITGRRRIGKTELAMHCGDQTILYFFVARKTERLLYVRWKRNLVYPSGGPTRLLRFFAM